MSMAIGGVMLAGSVVSAGAQELVSRPWQFGLVGGMTVPLGNLSQQSTTGWHAGALINLGVPLVPLGARIEATWYQMGTKSFGDGNSAKARIIAGTFDVTYTLATVPIVKPYLIGGVGAYNVKFDDTRFTTIGSNSQTRFGINAGAGLRVQLTGFSTFVEARWHDIFLTGQSRQMLPISVGISF
jgi:opacity protein-like surface antigen